jgi:outer membrane lipoprotein-sorting protein
MQRSHTRFARSILIFIFSLIFSLAVVLPAIAAPDTGLDNILSKLDETAAKFRTAEAKFTWTMFNSVINDVAETQTGTIYFRRSAKDVQMAANIDKPDTKQVIFSEGKIQVYQPKTAIVDVYDASAHREEFETFLVLGFGSSGQDIRKAFDVSYGGDEKIDGTDTAKLELVPKSEKIKQHFPQIILWIDPQKGLSVQEKLLEANGDYRLAKYSDIQLNQKIPDKVFKLKTSDKTRVVTH